MKRIVILALLLTLVVAPHARANPIDIYGLGSRQISLGGAGGATVEDSSANYYNPAGLVRGSDLRIDIGYRYAQPLLAVNGNRSDVDAASGKQLDPTVLQRGDLAIQTFTNGIDTRTWGLELSARYPIELSFGKLDLSVGANYNKTKVTKNKLGTLFSPTAQQIIEKASPDFKGNFSALFTSGKFATNLRVNYYRVHAPVFESLIGVYLRKRDVANAFWWTVPSGSEKAAKRRPPDRYGDGRPRSARPRSWWRVPLKRLRSTPVPSAITSSS